MGRNFKGNNSIVLHISVQHHNSTIMSIRSIIKDPSITHHVDITREIEEASKEEVMEEEALEEVEDQ
jgi:hypothetical protein